MRSERFRKAIEAFDAIHRQDPEQIIVEGQQVSKSLLYHRRLTQWVRRLSEEPSEVLLLAARCQHLERKAIPRDRFPMGTRGYRQWRTRLADFHVEKATEILQRIGYSRSCLDRLRDLLQKRRLKIDPEVQLLEDSICLVFLEIELIDFSRKHDEAKLLNILRKTWGKMSPRGHRHALNLAKQLPQDLQQLLGRALVLA
jgi:hypothetical protein